MNQVLAASSAGRRAGRGWAAQESCLLLEEYQGTVVVGILLDACCISSHNNGRQLGVCSRTSSVSHPLRHFTRVCLDLLSHATYLLELS